MLVLLEKHPLLQVQVDPLKILKEAEKKFLYSPEKKANKKAGLYKVPYNFIFFPTPIF